MEGRDGTLGSGPIEGCAYGSSRPGHGVLVFGAVEGQLVGQFREQARFHLAVVLLLPPEDGGAYIAVSDVPACHYPDRVARLLHELPSGGLLRGLPGLDVPAGHLPAVATLVPDHQEIITVEGYRVGGSPHVTPS